MEIIETFDKNRDLKETQIKKMVSMETLLVQSKDLDFISSQL